MERARILRLLVATVIMHGLIVRNQTHDNGLVAYAWDLADQMWREYVRRLGDRSYGPRASVREAS